MTPFQFCDLKEEEKEAIRSDQHQCIARLRACLPLVQKLAAVAGIETPLDADDEQLLQDFYLVQQALEGYEYEGLFEDLCDHAGLRPGDAGLLAGRCLALALERQPVQMAQDLMRYFLGT